MNNIEIGNRIKERRKLLNLTQGNLFELTNIKVAEISKYESGQKDIGLDIARRLSVGLRTTIEYLIYGEGDKEEIKDYFDNSVGNCIVNSIIILYQLHILDFGDNYSLFIHPFNKIVYELVSFMHTYLDHKEILENRNGRLYIIGEFESFKKEFNRQFSIQHCND